MNARIDKIMENIRHEVEADKRVDEYNEREQQSLIRPSSTCPYCKAWLEEDPHLEDCPALE